MAAALTTVRTGAAVQNRLGQCRLYVSAGSSVVPVLAIVLRFPLVV